MPYSVRLDRDRMLIAIALNGDVGDEELRSLSRDARAHPEMAAGIAILYDCSGVASVAVTRELVHDLGIRARNDTNRVAFVAPSPVAFGLARMYQIVSGGEGRMQIFADRAQAIEWLKGS
jgi:hypothetical protein